MGRIVAVSIKRTDGREEARLYPLKLGQTKYPIFSSLDLPGPTWIYQEDRAPFIVPAPIENRSSKRGLPLTSYMTVLKVPSELYSLKILKYGTLGTHYYLRTLLYKKLD